MIRRNTATALAAALTAGLAAFDAAAQDAATDNPAAAGGAERFGQEIRVLEDNVLDEVQPTGDPEAAARKFTEALENSKKAEAEAEASKPDAPAPESPKTGTFVVPSEPPPAPKPPGKDPDPGTILVPREAPPPGATDTNDPLADLDLPAFEEDVYKIENVDFAGDASLLDRARLRERIASELRGDLKQSELDQRLAAYNQALIDQGYFIASVRPKDPDPANPKLTLEVDQGRVGKLRFFGYGEGVQRGETRDLPDADKPAFPGRHFTEDQIKLRLGRYVKEGEPFNYLDFRRAVLELNSSPDIVMDTDLKVRREFGDTVDTYLDMDFFVEEKLPLHFAVELNNTGTEETEELRLFLSAQYVNLTKRDDVLTVSAPFSFPDVSVLQSVSVGYNLPYHRGNGGAVSLFGGYSNLDAEEIVPDLGLVGTGYFSGLRGFYRLVDNRDHLLNVTAGATFRSTEDSFVFAGEESQEDRNVEVVPVSLGLVYSSKEPDRFDGRNFLTGLAVYNLGDAAGVTDQDVLDRIRLNLEPDYAIGKLQLARIQPLLGRPDPQRPGRTKNDSYLFLRVDGQLASGPLVTSEQMAVGGLATVRGYPERDVAGDHGVHGTIELRSPILAGPLAWRLEEEDKTVWRDKLQAVVFVDAGYLLRDEEDETITDNFNMLSVGAGIRYSLTQYSQVRLDYGYPLEDTGTINYEDVDGSGRLHFSAQIQF